MGLAFPEKCSNKALAALTIAFTDMTGTAPLIQSAVLSLQSLTLTSCSEDADTGAAIGACTKLTALTMSSIEGAGLMGHADSRMFDTVYARTRHDGVMKHAKTLEQIMCPCSDNTTATHTL